MSNCFSGVCNLVTDPNKVSDKLTTIRAAFGGGDNTLFLELKFTGRLLGIANASKKGSQLFVSGELQSSTYKEKEYFSVFANNASFVNSGKRSGAKSSGKTVPALEIDGESDADISF